MKTVIMCGGSGTRLWPLSTPKHPKQFVKLFDDRSLFELTVKRNLFTESEFIIVTNEDHLVLAEKQFNNHAPKGSFLLEPVGRNTAPAIALAALQCDPEEIMIVLPADHLIKNEQNYQQVIKDAIKLAETNCLVTFGITPTAPETGYGYINYEGNKVISFKEKPDAKTATQYFESGDYLWNSGMFCFKAGVYLQELEKYSNEIFKTAKQTYANREEKEKVTKLNLADMKTIPSDSIDYAVMEKSDKVRVIPADIAWHDLGSFESLFHALVKDDRSNHINKNNVRSR